jgi:dihydrofolate synthase/folylpolyglutamate synthase
MTLDELIPWLFSRVTGGIRWGLERTEGLLAGVDNPHRHFRSVLIGGTNGKGSVAALTEAALRATGALRVGLYTSPHLVSFNERIRIDGVPVSDAALVEAAAKLRPAIEATGASFFEATTAMAFTILARSKVDIAVVEVGLGGRLDATNVVDPLVTAVTNISLDHAEYLGDRLEGIADEKAGIFKRGVPALVGEMDPRLLERLGAKASEVGAPFLALDTVARIDRVRTGIGGTSFRLISRAWGDRDLSLRLPGEHQARNAALAAELLALLPGEIRPDWDAVHGGFAAARWPGRLQVERIGDTAWVFDVAHNEAGMETLSAWLATAAVPRPRIAVVSVLRDKQWKGMLSRLAREIDRLVVTVAPSSPIPRRWELEEVRDWCTAHLDVRSTEPVGDFESALRFAGTTAEAARGSVVVTGSVHTVGDAMGVLGIAAV